MGETSTWRQVGEPLGKDRKMEDSKEIPGPQGEDESRFAGICQIFLAPKELRESRQIDQILSLRWKNSMTPWGYGVRWEVCLSWCIDRHLVTYLPLGPLSS